VSTLVWRVVGASARGIAHQEKDVSCQDAYRLQILSSGELLIAVADGAGSADRSNDGAHLAVEQAVVSLEMSIGEQSPIDEAGWRTLIADVFRKVYGTLALTAATENVTLRSFATTLTCVVVSDGWLVVGQIGDGVAVAEAEDGSLFLTVRPQRGEYANEAYFLTMPEALRYVEIHAYHQRVRALAVTTDGLLRLALKLPDYKPYPPFFQPLLGFIAEAEDENQAREQLVAFLTSDRVCARTDDDKTLVLAARLTPLPAALTY